jgi:hypothetical protein
LIRADGKIVERVDDSDGAVRSIFGELCFLWLQSAAALGKPQEYWVPLVLEIVDGDDYGCRNAFLENAHLLLTPETLRRLYDERLASSGVTQSAVGSTEKDFESLVFLTQVARALQDPALYYETERVFSPELNNLQVLQAIRVFIEFGQPARGRELLESTKWEDRFLPDSECLLVEVLEALGDRDGLKRLRLRMWERNPSFSNLQAYLEHCSAEESASVKETALARAEQDPGLVRGAGVLLCLKEFSRAEALLIRRYEDLKGFFYGDLLSLVEPLSPDESPVCQILLQRALLSDLLQRAYSKAYSHGARYMKNLRKLAAQTLSWPRGLDSHTVFEAELWLKHGRKYSFWKLVE